MECHWLASLDQHVSACIASICGKAIVGTSWTVEEDSCRKWLEDAIFGGAKLSSSATSTPKLRRESASRKEKEDTFLLSLAETRGANKDGTFAERLVYKMKHLVPEDQGLEENINVAVYSSIAALLWARHAASDAIRFAEDSVDKASDVLIKVWKLGQKMRQFFKLGDMRAAQVNENILPMPALGRGSSLYDGADVKVVNAVSKKIVEKARYLVSLPPPILEHGNAPRGRFQQAAALSMSRKTTFIEDSWKRAVGELQAAHKLSRFMLWRKIANERRKKNRVMSISERVLLFLQEDTMIETLTAVRTKRSERAEMRTVGLNLLQELIESSSTLRAKAWVVSSLQHLVLTRRADGGEPKTHFLNGVEGANPEMREKLRNAYFSVASAIVNLMEEVNDTHHNDDSILRDVDDVACEASGFEDKYEELIPDGFASVFSDDEKGALTASAERENYRVLEDGDHEANDSNIDASGFDPSTSISAAEEKLNNVSVMRRGFCADLHAMLFRRFC